MNEAPTSPETETPSTQKLVGEMTWQVFQAQCEAVLPCTVCEGKGTTFSKGFTYTPSDTGIEKVIPDREERCVWCEGAKTFPAIDIQRLVRLCFVAGKDGKIQRFYRSRPECKGQDRITQRRVYYLWRMARFHGGVDICLPMEAAASTKGDPQVPQLEVLCDAIARMVFGTNRAAAYRWGRLLIDPTLPEFPPGQPMSASSNYPAVTVPERESESDWE